MSDIGIWFYTSLNIYSSNDDYLIKLPKEGGKASIKIDSKFSNGYEYSYSGGGSVTPNKFKVTDLTDAPEGDLTGVTCDYGDASFTFTFPNKHDVNKQHHFLVEIESPTKEVLTKKLVVEYF